MTQTNKLIQTQRTNMILRQIRPWFVHDEAILNTLYHLPRENFFPDELKKFAFVDMEVPLVSGRMTHPPKLEGKILSYLDINENSKVLEIGTINGYLTAAMAKSAKKVYSFESHNSLFQKALDRLKNYPNIKLFQSSLTEAFTHEAVENKKFDIILINLPISKLLDKHLKLLAENGKLLCFEGSEKYMRCILATNKNGKITKKAVFEFNLKSEIIQTTERKFNF